MSVKLKLDQKSYFIGNQGLLSVYESDQENLKTCLVSGDTFSSALKPSLNEHVKKTIYIPNHIEGTGFIELEKPDIVIYQVVERYISRLAD